jgi:aminopeptidase N
VAQRELDWFFEVYVRQAELPRLAVERADSALTLRWDVPAGLPFAMPVDVAIDDEVRRVELPDGHARIAVGPDAAIAIDPNGWVLRSEP